MPQLSLDSQVAKDSDQVIDRVVDGEALLIHLHSGRYFSLNSVGTRVWECLDGSRSIKDLTAVVVSEYEVSEERAQADVLDLIGALLDENLAVVVQAS
jgi:hypothetical protein